MRAGCAVAPWLACAFALSPKASVATRAIEGEVSSVEGVAIGLNVAAVADIGARALLRGGWGKEPDFRQGKAERPVARRFGRVWRQIFP